MDDCVACAEESAGRVVTSVHRCVDPIEQEVRAARSRAEERAGLRPTPTGDRAVAATNVFFTTDGMPPRGWPEADEQPGVVVAGGEASTCATLADERTRFLRILAARPRPLYLCPASRLLTGARP